MSSPLQIVILQSAIKAEMWMLVFLNNNFI